MFAHYTGPKEQGASLPPPTFFQIYHPLLSPLTYPVFRPSAAPLPTSKITLPGPPLFSKYTTTSIPQPHLSSFQAFGRPPLHKSPPPILFQIYHPLPSSHPHLSSLQAFGRFPHFKNHSYGPAT